MTHGNIKLKTLTTILGNVTAGEDAATLSAASFCYSLMSGDSQPLIWDILALVEDYKKYLLSAQDDGVNTGEINIEELDSLLVTVFVITKRCRQMSVNPNHANNELSWSPSVIEKTKQILPQVSELLVNIQANQPFLNYLKTKAPSKHEKFMQTFKDYNEYDHCTKFITEFAIDSIMVHGGEQLFQVIEDDTKEIKEIGSKSRYVHADMKALEILIQNESGELLQYIPLSRLACGMCFHIIKHEADTTLSADAIQLVRGTHGIFYPEDWVVPEFCFKDDISRKNMGELIQLAGNYVDIQEFDEQGYILHA